MNRARSRKWLRRLQTPVSTSNGYADIGGVVHLLTKDVTAARRALETAGIPVQRDQQVLVVQIENPPGAAAKILRRIADAGMNVHFSYVAANNRLVIGVTSLRKAADLRLGGAV